MGKKNDSSESSTVVLEVIDRNGNRRATVTASDAAECLGMAKGEANNQQKGRPAFGPFAVKDSEGATLYETVPPEPESDEQE